MAVNFWKGRSLLLSWRTSPRRRIRYLLDLARDLKAKRRAGISRSGLAGQAHRLAL